MNKVGPNGLRLHGQHTSPREQLKLVLRMMKEGHIDLAELEPATALQVQRAFTDCFGQASISLAGRVRQLQAQHFAGEINDEEFDTCIQRVVNIAATAVSGYQAAEKLGSDGIADQQTFRDSVQSLNDSVIELNEHFRDAKSKGDLAKNVEEDALTITMPETV